METSREHGNLRSQASKVRSGTRPVRFVDASAAGMAGFLHHPETSHPACRTITLSYTFNLVCIMRRPVCGRRVCFACRIATRRWSGST
ncbi:hypothetical protein ACKZDW_19385 [Ralstonia syzygii subsp. celebesensis]|uniref:hypothetical protein n=1 Tax=Ralstonia syzygii TaxID=28097 RepID=UPI00155F68EC|nr:hypothetical protein [Ralstonia syzygii]QQV57126.1 hypothetical protein JK151_05380 [Ralstonia syzygii subsp. celebesensis]